MGDRCELVDERPADERSVRVGTADGFQCALSRNGAQLAFHACSSPKSYRHLKPGKYTFEVEALNGSLADPTPAKKKFTIKR